MANFDTFWPTILKHEGLTFTNHPADRGGPTKMGVTLKTWQAYGYDKDGDGKITANDVKLITEADAKKIAKRLYWDYFQGDLIVNQSIAELVVDWGWGSGPGTASNKIRSLLSVPVGKRITAKDINAIDSTILFEQIKNARVKHINAIVANNPTQKVFYKGWMNRINAFDFVANNPATTLAGLALCLMCWYAIQKYQKEPKFQTKINNILHFA